MHTIKVFFTFAVLAIAALANKCNHDNCYRAMAHYQASDTCFCNEYLATATKEVPSPIATCEAKKISSACTCLTTTTTPPTTASPTITPPTTASPAATTPTTTLTTSTASTCARSSASACPTPATKCCAYLCAEAQVPFDLCSETDTSGQFQVCNKCLVS